MFDEEGDSPKLGIFYKGYDFILISHLSMTGGNPTTRPDSLVNDVRGKCIQRMIKESMDMRFGEERNN